MEKSFCKAAALTALGLLFLSAAHAAPAAADTARPAKESLNPNTFVQQVLERNSSIRAQEAGHDAAVAHITSAGALDDPMISYLSAPETIGTPMGYRQNVQISQRIPWPGTLTLRTLAARADAESAQYRVADIRLKLAAQARAAFAEWYYVHRAIAINNDTIKIVERLKSVAAAAYASGQTPEQDVLQAEVELTRLQNQSLELERRRRTVQAQINNLLNTDPESPVGPPDALPAPQFLQAYTELQATALEQYPALKSLDATVDANRDRVRVAEKGFYPNITLMVGENTLMSPASMQPSVGIALNIPISGMHSGELDEASAKARQSEAELIAMRSQLLSDLDATYAGVQQARDTIDLYGKRLVPLAGLNLKAAESDYRTGTGDFLKLITAEQQDLMVELEQERARADLYTRLAALDYETGGAVFTDISTESTP